MIAMLYKCFFDDFKEEMTYQYGYDSSAEINEELVYGETRDVDNNECSLCGFKGKTSGGLKTHVGRKHRYKDKTLWEMQICSMKKKEVKDIHCV